MTTLRLYRGIKEKYKSEKVNINNHGTDFTDCPFRATLYAKARNGYLLVVDAPIGQRPLLVTEEQYIFEEGCERLCNYLKEAELISTDEFQQLHEAATNMLDRFCERSDEYVMTLLPAEKIVWIG